MAFYFLFLIQISFGAETGSACSWDDLLRSCDSVKSRIAKLAEQKSPKLKIKKFSEKKTDLDRMFQQVKTAMQDVLLDGRDRSQLSAAEEALFVKVTKVRLISPEKASGYSCEGKSQLNGRYFSDLHAFTLCPGFDFLPDSAYFASMAHELSHVIDPCMSQFGLVRLNTARIDENRSSGRFDGFIQSEVDDWKQDIDEYNHRVREQNPRTVHTWRGKYSAKMLADLKSAGLIEELAPAISNDNYPFKKVIACLQTVGTKSTAANLPKTDETKEPVFPHCPGRVLGAMSQVPESISDVFAGKILSKLLKTNPPSAEDQPMTFWLLLQKACLSTDPLKTNPQVYMSAKERVDKLLSSNKDLRSVLKCPPTNIPDCSEQMKSIHRLKSSEPRGASSFGGITVDQ